MRKWLWVVAPKHLLLALLVACGGGKSSATPDAPSGDGPLPDTMGPCVPSTKPATKVFLNRAGGTYTNGAVDSSNNISNIVPAGDPTTLPAPTIVEADWTAVRTCLDELFSPFNIELTETDPGAAEHQELVVIDTPGQLGLENGVSAVSPTSPCDPATNEPVPALKGIAFMMWAQFGNTPQSNRDRCEVIAQAIAATYGLDHSFSCPDVMTFLTGCGAKSFTDVEVPCGEFEARACNCGGNTQNSYRHLADFAGETCE